MARTYSNLSIFPLDPMRGWRGQWRMPIDGGAIERGTRTEIELVSYLWHLRFLRSLIFRDRG